MPRPPVPPSSRDDTVETARDSSPAGPSDEGVLRRSVRRVARVRVPLLVGALAIVLLTVFALLGNDQEPRQLRNGTDAGRAPATQDPGQSNPADWALVKKFDLSRNDGGWSDTGEQATRDSSRSRLEQARFGTGPRKDWLTVTAQRDNDAAQIYSVDLLGRGHRIPNYFAVDLVYRLPDVGIGMWPAPLWFRPLETPVDPRPEGEIDVVEWFGSRVLEFDEASGSIHKTPYGPAHRQLSLPLPALAGSQRQREHHVRFEKTPGVMTWWVDGEPAGSLTRTEFDAEAGERGAWNAMFENPRRQWYPRITYQVGPGVDGDQAGQVPPRWRNSQMVIKRLEVFKARL